MRRKINEAMANAPKRLCKVAVIHLLHVPLIMICAFLPPDPSASLAIPSGVIPKLLILCGSLFQQSHPSLLLQKTTRHVLLQFRKHTPRNSKGKNVRIKLVFHILPC